MTAKPKAYSYLRFSTPEQIKGDSLRRQTQLAVKYCRDNGLELDTETTYRDLGVSAYRGKNSETGRLGEFLEAARTGLIPEGSYLLVESLDRVSRQAARTALKVLEAICDSGITVVTLSDNRAYTAASLTNDPISLLVALLTFIRSNEESAMKSQRLSEVRADERRLALTEKKPITGKCPGWLTLDKEEGAFRVIEHRADVVRRIFDEALAGRGKHAIADGLNRDAVPTFGKAGHWQRSYIQKVLENPAVVGTFVPCIVVTDKDGKKSRIPQEPISGYFPAVISTEDFANVRDMKAEKGRRTAHRGKHAEEVRNLFGGLVRCGCGATATVVYKGVRGGYRYLKCTKRKLAGEHIRPVRYSVLEEQFLNHADAVLAHALRVNRAGARALEKEQASTAAAIDGINEKLRELVAVIESGQRSGVITLRIAELEKEKAALEERNAELLERVDATSPELVKRRTQQLKAALKADPMDRALVNAQLRRLFKGIRLDPKSGTAWFVWESGGETELTIGLPDDA